MAKTHNPTSVRLGDEEKRLLKAVQEHLHHISENDVFRYVLREYAREHNIKPRSRHYQPLRLHPRLHEYAGITSDGRAVYIWRDIVGSGETHPRENDDTDWWAEHCYRFPPEYSLIRIYCGVCEHCSQIKGSENIEQGQHCSCSCHKTGIALPTPDEP